MSIDRIGKGTPPVAVPPAESPGAASQPFSVGVGVAGPAASAGVGGVGAVGSTALDQLRAGQIDLGRYLDLKVSEATAHLAALPAAQLDAIRSDLRDRLASDPGLVELVALAGRAAPSSSTGPSGR